MIWLLNQWSYHIYVVFYTVSNRQLRATDSVSLAGNIETRKGDHLPAMFRQYSELSLIFEHAIKNELTDWNTSEPSSKSIKAKNSLLLYDEEYRHEFAII